MREAGGGDRAPEAVALTRRAALGALGAGAAAVAAAALWLGRGAEADGPTAGADERAPEADGRACTARFCRNWRAVPGGPEGTGRCEARACG